MLVLAVAIHIAALAYFLPRLARYAQRPRERGSWQARRSGVKLDGPRGLALVLLGCAGVAAIAVALVAAPKIIQPMVTPFLLLVLGRYLERETG
jgi:hypothetical protein